MSGEASGPAFDWCLEGRAWVFGDDIGVDGDLMPLRFALERETRPEVLAEHVFSGIDPGFAGRAAPGDIVVAGTRFAQGNPHVQGLLGLRGAGLGLLAESIPSGSYRNAVNAGLRFLPRCPGVRTRVADGDRLRVDFRLGTVDNLVSGERLSYAPIPGPLLDIVARGGWAAHFRERLASDRG